VARGRIELPTRGFSVAAPAPLTRHHQPTGAKTQAVAAFAESSHPRGSRVVSQARGHRRGTATCRAEPGVHSVGQPRPVGSPLTGAGVAPRVADAPVVGALPGSPPIMSNPKWAVALGAISTEVRYFRAVVSRPRIAHTSIPSVGPVSDLQESSRCSTPLRSAEAPETFSPSIVGRSGGSTNSSRAFIGRPQAGLYTFRVPEQQEKEFVGPTEWYEINGNVVLV